MLLPPSTILISRTIVHSKSHSIHLKAGDTNPEVFCSAKKFVFSLLSRFFERNRNDQHGRPGQLIPSLGFSKNFRQSKVTGENGSWNAITTLFLKRCSRTFQGLGFLFFSVQFLHSFVSNKVVRLVHQCTHKGFKDTLQVLQASSNFKEFSKASSSVPRDFILFLRFSLKDCV